MMQKPISVSPDFIAAYWSDTATKASWRNHRSHTWHRSWLAFILKLLQTPAKAA